MWERSVIRPALKKGFLESTTYFNFFFHSQSLIEGFCPWSQHNPRTLEIYFPQLPLRLVNTSLVFQSVLYWFDVIPFCIISIQVPELQCWWADQLGVYWLESKFSVHEYMAFCFFVNSISKYRLCPWHLWYLLCKQSGPPDTAWGSGTGLKRRRTPLSDMALYLFSMPRKRQCRPLDVNHRGIIHIPSQKSHALLQGSWSERWEQLTGIPSGKISYRCFLVLISTVSVVHLSPKLIGICDSIGILRFWTGSWCTEVTKTTTIWSFIEFLYPFHVLPTHSKLSRWMKAGESTG